MKKFKTFEQFVKEYDGDTAPLGRATGEDQFDPDKPKETQVDELIAALDDIIDIAKRAKESNGGLSYKSARRASPPPKDREPENRVSRPKADGPEALFGHDR